MKKIILILIVLSAVGCFLPWYGISAEIMGQSSSRTIIGFDYLSYGLIVFIAAIVTLILSFIKLVQKFRVIPMLVVLVFSFMPFLNHPNTGSVDTNIASANSGFMWGIYFTIGFALITVILIVINDYFQSPKKDFVSSKSIFNGSSSQNDQKTFTSDYQHNKQITDNKINCPKCLAPNSVNTKFCINCGSALEIISAIETNQICTGCGTKLVQGVKFCPNCGKENLQISSKKEIDFDDL
jgi:hypothetical protein